jgi:hypothetical protein
MWCFGLCHPAVWYTGTNIKQEQLASTCKVNIYYSEDSDGMLFQYDGTFLPHYVVSYPRRLQYESAELQIHQISN